VYLDSRNPSTWEIEIGVIVNRNKAKARSTDGNTSRNQKSHPHHPMKITQNPRLTSRSRVKVNINSIKSNTAKRYDIRMPIKVCKTLLIVYPKLDLIKLRLIFVHDYRMQNT